MPSSKASNHRKSGRKSGSGTKTPSLLDFFGSKPPCSEKSTGRAASQRQTSIQSFFSTASKTESTNNREILSSCPSTPPSPFTPLNQDTPPSPATGTHSTANRDHDGTPPSAGNAASIHHDRSVSISQTGDEPPITVSKEIVTKTAPFAVPVVPVSPKELRYQRPIRTKMATEGIAVTENCDILQSEPPKTVRSSVLPRARGENETEPPQSTTPETSDKSAENPSLLRPNPKRKASQQLYLDFGQSNFAKRSICTTCGMLYVHGLTADSQQHSRICDNHVKGVPFQAPLARVVARHPLRGSIVEVRPTDSYALRQKVSQVKAIVDQELGFSQMDGPLHRTAYLYVLDKRVVGMATAEIIPQAFFLENNLERSREPTKAMVGIHQLWVHVKYRENGIGTHLVDAVRAKMVFGLVVPPHLLAFSSPTEAGANFARRYVESLAEEGTSVQVLVYDCR